MTPFNNPTKTPPPPKKSKEGKKKNIPSLLFSSLSLPPLKSQVSTKTQKAFLFKMKRPCLTPPPLSPSSSTSSNSSSYNACEKENKPKSNKRTKRTQNPSKTLSPNGNAKRSSIYRGVTR